MRQYIPTSAVIVLALLAQTCTDADWSFRPRDSGIDAVAHDDRVIAEHDGGVPQDTPAPIDRQDDRLDAPTLADADIDRADTAPTVDHGEDVTMDVLSESSRMDVPADLAGEADAVPLDAADVPVDASVAESALTDMAGVDACSTGLSACVGGCVDLTRDNANCGVCGRACVGSEHCLAGSCRPMTAWARVAGSPFSAQGDAVAVDSAGNIYFAGNSSGPIDLGGGPLSPAGTTTSYAFVASFTAAGVHRWSQGLGGPGGMMIRDLAIGPDGSLFVIGNNVGPTNIGGTPLVSGSFLLSMASSGTLRWVHDLSPSGAVGAYDLMIDSTGNLWVAGSFSGTVNLGGGPMTSAGDTDILIASFSNAGVYRGSHRMGGPGGEMAQALAMDALGNLLVTGVFLTEFDPGGGLLTSTTRVDGFLVSLSDAGAFRWARRFGGDDGSYVFSMVLDNAGNSYITGAFFGNWTVGGRVFAAGSEPQAYVTSFSPSGDPRWTTAFGAAGQDYARSIALDPMGNLYVTGEVQRTVDFGGGALVGLGGIDLFAMSLTSAGLHRWSRRYGGTLDDRGHGIAVAAGSIFIAGHTEGVVDLGVSPLGGADRSNVLLLALAQ